MNKIKFLVLSSLCIIVLITGCTLPGIGMAAPSNAAPDQSNSNSDLQTQVALFVAQTVVAQTVAAVNGPAATEAVQPNNTPEFTFTPSLTPTVTFTDTPNAPMVSVSMETNCRTGPGTAYDAIGVLPVGQSAEVVGQYKPSNYWIIHLPSNPAITCWLWGQYATVVGNTSGLADFTPPPTPTPKYSPTPQSSFQLQYSNVSHCPAVVYAINFKITNDGATTWESNHVYITDTVTSETQDTAWDNFPRYDSCGIASADLNLDPGEVGYTYYGLIGNPAGHNITAKIRVCSQNGMTGTCMEKTINFTP